MRRDILNALILEIVFFCIIFILGFFSALEGQKILTEENVEIPKIEFTSFLLYFLFGTLFILSIIYFPKIKKFRGKIYKFLFIFAFIYGALAIFASFLPDVITIVLIFLLLFLWFKYKRVIVHDILIILSLAGIGAMFGLAFEPKVVILLLLVLSFYDFIAVYKTKHMIKMATSMIEHGVIMGLIIPQKMEGFLADIKEVKPGGKFMFLGGGDIIFPLLFSVSMLSIGIVPALIVGGFSLLGLIASLLIFFLQKDKKPIPALPPIALFAIIGYIITMLC